MHPETYRLMAQVEEQHWWFRARRHITGAAIEHLALPPDAKILEAGCGTGGNLAMLVQFGEVRAFEPDEHARVVAQSKQTGRVETGGLPDAIPSDLADLDLVCAFDVLEHIEDDRAAAAALLDRLKHGGHLLVTVPALGWLWSRHDDAVAHKRRYTRQGLVELLHEAGFEVQRCSYYNSLLFLPIAVVRVARRMLRIEGDGTQEMALPGNALNRLLYAVFAFERRLLETFDLPLGVSLLAVARRPR